MRCLKMTALAALALGERAAGRLHLRRGVRHEADLVKDGTIGAGD